MSLHGRSLRSLRQECASEASAEAASGEAAASAEARASASSPLRAARSAAPQGTSSGPPSPVARLVLPSPHPPRRGSGRCELEAPKFTAEGGKFAEEARVGLTCQPGVKLRYLVEKLPEGAERGQQGRHTVLAADGLLYRSRPIVLDEYGVYLVHAMCMRDDPDTQVSAVVSQRYEVCRTEAQPLQGAHLATLPTQMVRGFLRFAGATTKAIAPRLESMRRAIARIARTAEDRVTVKLQGGKKDGKASSARAGGGVNVSFSVRVGREDDSEAMVKRVTDPSLVEEISDTTGLTANKITVEAAVKPLEAVLLYMEWTYPLSGRDYLDGSCLVYAQDRLLDVVDYRGAQSVHGSKASSATCEWSAGRGETGGVVHSGDVMSHRGGRHAIVVRLSSLPAAASECFFTLSAYFCRNLSKFVVPRVLFFDLEDKGQRLASYDVVDAGCASAAVVCALSRERGGAWSVISYGQTCDGTVRDYSPIEAAIAPVQARHARWRSRAPLVLLAWLWHQGRALPRGSAEREEVVMPLLDLEPDLFRNIVGFL